MCPVSYLVPGQLARLLLLVTSTPHKLASYLSHCVLGPWPCAPSPFTPHALLLPPPGCTGSTTLLWLAALARGREGAGAGATAGPPCPRAPPRPPPPACTAPAPQRCLWRRRQQQQQRRQQVSAGGRQTGGWRGEGREGGGGGRWSTAKRCRREKLHLPYHTPDHEPVALHCGGLCELLGWPAHTHTAQGYLPPLYRSRW